MTATGDSEPEAQHACRNTISDQLEHSRVVWRLARNRANLRETNCPRLRSWMMWAALRLMQVFAGKPAFQSTGRWAM